MPEDNPRGYHVVVVYVWIKTRKNDYENGGSRINLMLGYFMQSISFIIIYNALDKHNCFINIYLYLNALKLNYRYLITWIENYIVLHLKHYMSSSNLYEQRRFQKQW